MKNIKRLAAIILALLVFALTLPTAVVFADDSDMRYGRTKLNSTEQKVYDIIANCCAKDTPTQIEIDRNWNVTVDQLHNAFRMFYSDYPEYFWVENGNYGWSCIGDTVVRFVPSYCFSNVASAKSAYNAKVNQLTSGLSGSDYEKSKVLHDRLIDTVVYTTTNNDQNAYGALVEGKAVCNGYARAYQHLLLKAGIPAWYIRGSSTNPSTGTPEAHAWNMAKLDGQWYYTDVTWDDQNTNTFYAYFNITKDQLNKDHTFDTTYESLVPNATATTANYYVKEGRVFTSYDQAKFVSLLKKDSNKTQIYIDGNVNSFVSSLNSNLTSIASDLGATGNYSVSSSMSKLGNALIINVVVISGNHTHAVKTTVGSKDATCLSPGTKACYICDCGLKFLDQACTQQITDDKQLEITAKSHTPSTWKNNASDHWKECTSCGSETVNTRSAHGDSNKDNKCDTCGYALPVADESGNITIGTPSNSTPSNQTASQNVNSSAESDVSSKTESDDSVAPTESAESEISSDDEPSSVDELVSTYEEDTYLYASEKLQNSALKWIVICGVAALFVAAATTVIVILVNKKHS